MKNTVCLIFAAMALATCGAAQGRQDTCKIFVWDNDAGECAQEQPAVMMNASYDCYAVWSDLRDGNYNIYGQWTNFDGEPLGNNFLVNSNPSVDWGSEKNPDISGYSTASNRFAVVWQDSMTTGQWRIYGRLFTAACEPASTGDFLISKTGTAPKTRPRVAMRLSTGYFAVVWMQYRTINNLGDIYIRLFDPSGAAVTDTIRVNSDTTGLQRRPCVMFNDVGIAVAWEDWRNGSFPVIRGQKYDPGLNPIGINFSISNTDYYADSPDIDAIDGSDFYAVTWNSRQPLTARNIRACRFSFSTGMIDQEFIVNPVLLLSHGYNPTIAVLPAGDCVIAWQDSVTSARAAETFVRYCYPYTATLDTGNYFLANEQSPRNQEYPVIANYGNNFTVAWHDSVRPTGRGDIFGQNGNLITSTNPDTIRKFHPNYRIDNLLDAGRKVWYRPKKNYDNPLTPWNEDPIVEPDSLYVPLDSAFVRAFAERNNVPGQQFVRITDSPILAETYHDDQKSAINGGDYDACVMDLGYSTAALGAGEISADQQDSLKAFADSGGALLCSGNDFGQYYYGTPLFNIFGATYDGPGNPSSTGNIDSLLGMSDAFTKGMAFDYPFQKDEDNSVDIIHSSTAGDTIFISGGPAKWAYCRATSYSSYFKAPAWHKNIYLPFSMGALTSNGKYPNTAAELTRRMLAFQNFNVEPAPITDLAVDTTTSSNEGTVTIRWAAVSDDTLTERATSYQLKVKEYNAALPEYGKFTSEQDYYDSGQTYYQTWTPAAPGSNEFKTIYLAPGKSYIFALKAGDEGTPTRWSELGAEPMTQTRGDTLTPHTLYLGAANGLMNQFAANELLDTDSGDTLYFTWDTAYLEFGFSRRDWRTEGDLFIYLDTKAGGADSTIGDWNGAAADTAALFDTGGDFKPDFCFALDSLGSKCKLLYWTGTAWAESIATYSSANYYLDLLNNTLLTTLRIQRTKIGSPATLKFLAVRLDETSERCYSSFPPENPTGVKGAKAITRYPYYYDVASLADGLSPRNIAAPLAVELSHFNALAGSRAVTLSWSTSSETDNYQWLIERSRDADGNYTRIATIPSQGTGASGHSYSYADPTVQPGETYYYMLGDLDRSGATAWHGPVSVTVPGSAISSPLLEPAMPNPSRDGAIIRFALPQDGRVSLVLYDICGRQVRTLRNGNLPVGWHSAPWDGKDDQGRVVSTGVYFYRLNFSGMALTRKITLIK